MSLSIILFHYQVDQWHHQQSSVRVFGYDPKVNKLSDAAYQTRSTQYHNNAMRNEDAGDILLVVLWNDKVVQRIVVLFSGHVNPVLGFHRHSEKK